MKVEIWSDIMCPFCYIGKRRFDAALEQFADKDQIEVEWKSYQLMPGLETDPGKSLEDLLVETKGMSRDQVRGMNYRVTQMAAQVGLTYHLDQSIPVNTFKAHQFTHFAKTQGKQIEAEEALFKAYFTNSENIDDNRTLVALGKEIGLDTVLLQAALAKGIHAEAVRNDILEAQQLGVRGVPFFVFDRKQAISGAQERQAFSEVLATTYTAWCQNHPEGALTQIDGAVCAQDGTCG